MNAQKPQGKSIAEMLVEIRAKNAVETVVTKSEPVPIPEEKRDLAEALGVTFAAGATGLGIAGTIGGIGIAVGGTAFALPALAFAGGTAIVGFAAHQGAKLVKRALFPNKKK